MTRWPHSPSHIFNDAGTYMVTGATLHKQHFFTEPKYLDDLQALLFQLANKYEWHLEAWALFSNHYHLIAHSADPSSLRRFITHLHASSARELNRAHKISNRKIWYQFWDTRLTYQKSYLARLNYVMQNPVKHQLVLNSEDYPWCSVKWFAENTELSYQAVIASFKTDTVQVHDDF